MANIGTLTILLGVTTSGMNKAIRDTKRLERSVHSSALGMQASVASLNTALLNFGRVMTQFATFPAAVLSGFSISTFSKFEYNLSKVTGLVGVANEQTKEWGESIKDLGSVVAEGPIKLSEALYFITTGGVRGAETMEVLKVAAKAAAVGMGEVSEVADIIVSAMNAYGKENLSAAQAADILTVSVREGKAEADKLVQAFGVVLPIASKMGVSFDQVGTALAAMTRTGTRASTAGQQLRQILNKLINPTNETNVALRTMGTTAEELRKKIREDGLLDTLIHLNDLTKQYGEDAITHVFPRIRALIGVLDILGENLSENIEIEKKLTNAQGALNAAFDVASQTWKFKLNAVLAEGQSLLIELGEALTNNLAPALSNILQTLRTWTDNFSKLDQSTQQAIVQFTKLAIVIGPAIVLFNILRNSVLLPLVSVYGFVDKAMFGMLNTQTKLIPNVKLLIKTGKSIADAEASRAASAAAAASAMQKETAATINQTEANQSAAASTEYYTGTITRLGSTELATIRNSKARVIVIWETMEALNGASASVERYALSMAKASLVIDYNRIRLAALAAIYTSYITGVNLSTKALNYNIERYAHISAALSKLNADLTVGTQAIIMHTTALSSHQKALGYDIARYAALLEIMKQHHGILGLNISAIESETAAFVLNTNQKALNASSVRGLIIVYNELSTSLAIVNSQLLAMLGTIKLYGIQMSALTGQTVLVNNALKAHSAQLALGAAQVTVQASAWARLNKVLLLFAQNASVALKGVWATLLTGIKYVGLMIARFVMLNAWIGAIAIIGTALYGAAKGLGKFEDASKKAFDTFSKSVSEAKKLAVEEQAQLQRLTNIAQNQKLPEEVRAKAIKNLQELAPDYLGTLTKENALTKEGTKLINDYSKAIERVSQARQFELDLLRIERERIEDVQEGQDRQLTFWEKARKGGVVYAAFGRVLGLFVSAEKEAGWEAEKAANSLDTYTKSVDRLKRALDAAIYNSEDFIRIFEGIQKAVSNIQIDEGVGPIKSIEDRVKKQIEAEQMYQAYLEKMMSQYSDNEMFNTLKKQIDNARSEGEKIMAQEVMKESFPDYMPNADEFKSQSEERLKILENELLRVKEFLTEAEKHELNVQLNLDYEKIFVDLENELENIGRFGAIMKGVPGIDLEVLTRQLNAYKKTLDSASGFEQSLNDERIKAYRQQYDIIKIILGSIEENKNKLMEVNDAGVDLTESYKKQYKIQNDVANTLERANKALSIMRLYKKMPWLVEPQDLVGLEELKDILEKLEKLGPIAAAEVTKIKNLIKGFEFKEDLEDFNESMDNLNKRIDALGSNSELLNAKLQLLNKQWRALLTAPYENVDEWVSSLRKLSRQIIETRMEIELMEGLKNVFVSIGEGLGKMVSGAENAFSGLLSALISVFKKMGEILIEIGVPMLAIPGLRGTGAAYIAGGAAIIAIASAIETEVRKGSKAAKMAQGGIVPQGYSNDSYPALLSSGEMVIPPHKLPETNNTQILAYLNSIVLILRSINNKIEKSNGLENYGYLIKGKSFGIGLGAMFNKYDLKMTKMAQGGIVPQGYPNDSYPAMLTSGERVIPPHKLPEFETRPIEIKLNGDWKIKGRDLYYVIREEERLIGNVFS